MLNQSNYSIIHDILKEKTKLEFYNNCGLVEIYRSARLFCFPEKSDLGQQRNRAGKKLKEIFDEFPEFSLCESFIDLCGGPGAWSIFMTEFPSTKGWGLTMNTTDACRNWYPDLRKNEKFTCLDLSQTNDICDDVVRSEMKKYTCDLVLADGAPSEASYPDENLQELYAARIIFSEIVVGFNCLIDKGKMIVKIFDTFSDAMKSLIYLVVYSFNKVFVYKPPSSRVVNSERYLICLGYKRKIGKNIVSPIVEHTLKNWKDGDYPSSLIPVHNFHTDTKFQKSYHKYITDSSTQQLEALVKVNEVLDEWTTNRSNKQNSKQSKGTNTYKGKASTKDSKCKDSKSNIYKGKGIPPNQFPRHDCHQAYKGRNYASKAPGKGPREHSHPYNNTYHYSDRPY